MKKKLFILLAFLTASCGPIKVEPIKVEGEIVHTININATDVVEFFRAYCEDKFDDPTDINQCMAESLALFWTAVQEASQ